MAAAPSSTLIGYVRSISKLGLQSGDVICNTALVLDFCPNAYRLGHAGAAEHPDSESPDLARAGSAPRSVQKFFDMADVTLWDADRCKALLYRIFIHASALDHRRHARTDHLWDSPPFFSFEISVRAGYKHRLPRSPQTGIF
jgi:hypothetical protein